MEGLRPAPTSLPTSSKPAYTPILNLTKAIKRQSDYRLAVGWLVLAFWVVSVWSLDWDADWHTRVGRDGFWTPPHLVFYSTIAGAGIICALVVILETLLYYRRDPGYTDQTTTPIWFFHGPLGFALAGFGMAVMLGSAPLDDYWHRIYGVDVKVWSPFHVMLLIGIIMASLGIVYLFASEVTRRRHWQTAEPPANLGGRLAFEVRSLFQPATLGLIVAMVALITRYVFLMGSDTLRGTLQIGDARLPAYSLVIAVVPALLVALTFATGRVGSATLAGLFMLLFVIVDKPLIQLGVDYLVTDQGREMRSNLVNQVTWTYNYPLSLPIIGLIVDGLYLLTARWRKDKALPGLIVAGLASMLGGLIIFLLDKNWEQINNLIRDAVEATKNALFISRLNSLLFKPDYWQALPLVLLVALLSGVAGWALAVSLRNTER